MATEEHDSKIISAPVLGRPEDFPQLQGRDRGPGRFLAYLVIGAIVLAMTVGWGFVIMLSRGAPDVRGQVISFTTDDPGSLTMTIQVTKPAGRTAVCRLRAVDTDGAEVGSREIEVTGRNETVTRTERVQTSARAWNGQIQHCYLVQ
jgi:hypothetical protein